MLHDIRLLPNKVDLTFHKPFFSLTIDKYKNDSIFSIPILYTKNNTKTYSLDIKMKIIQLLKMAIKQKKNFIMFKVI
jgi:hypothetical protein